MGTATHMPRFVAAKNFNRFLFANLFSPILISQAYAPRLVVVLSPLQHNKRDARIAATTGTLDGDMQSTRPGTNAGGMPSTCFAPRLRPCKCPRWVRAPAPSAPFSKIKNIQTKLIFLVTSTRACQRSVTVFRSPHIVGRTKQQEFLRVPPPRPSLPRASFFFAPPFTHAAPDP